MSQTRFYVAENRVVAPHVSLFVGGLPPGLSTQEYASLLDEAVAAKGVTAWAGPGLLGPGPTWVCPPVRGLGGWCRAEVGLPGVGAGTCGDVWEPTSPRALMAACACSWPGVREPRLLLPR